MDNEKALIKVEKTIIGEEEVNAVDGRELHAFLGVGKDFPTWIKNRMEKYNFAMNSDFYTFLGKSSGGRPSTEYVLSIDTAKELSMVENNEKGKQARRYFIACEKKLREIPPHGEKTKKIKPPTRSKIAADLAANVRIAKTLGLKGNQALLSGNRMTADQYLEYDVNPIQEAGVELISERQVQYLTVSAIGKQHNKGLSGVQVNKKLEEAGFQEATRDHKGKLVWVPTQEGKKYCQMLDTGKKHTQGSPVLQLKWEAGMLEKLDRSQAA